ncbi:MAG: GntR family transcriptional regulator [Thermomicrobiales bacterium]|nr:GntR family transcriptional regulator [Thermomicrobiales bacterium]
MATAFQRSPDPGDRTGDAFADWRLDRSSPVPLYHQVYNAILGGIRDGRLGVDDVLPTEAELCERFGVSRITIRQALADLLNDGHLARERSRGPLLIKSAPIEQRLARLTSFFIADALAQGHDPHYVLRGVERVGADDDARALGLAAGDVVTRVERLLTDRSEPIAMLTSFIPDRRCPNLHEFDLNGSLMQIIARQYGLHPTDATQWLSARGASEGERKILALEPRATVIVIRRLTRTRDGQALEFLECVLRADRYQFVMELSQE